MDSGELSPGELFRLITGYEPYDYQLTAWEKIENAMSNGGKVVIEVPTAGGKTEAAVIPFLTEVYNGTWAVSRLIYVLPTRSLVEKQAERIRKLLAEVLNLRGKSEEEAKELAERFVTVEYGLEPTHALLGWVIVTTWDAFLYGLAAHRTVGKRFTFPAGAIAQSLVVFDEVQMYQDEGLYMPRLLSLVVETLEKANVPVVVMSATIPTKLREMIARGSEIVTVKPDDGRKPERGKVSVQVVEGTLDDVLDEIKNALEGGKKVLVVRNTVDRAVSAYLKLKTLSEEFGVEPLLIHGRFTAGDRKEKEKAIDNARLIVATQVVEAGLDLPNVGLVVTDIAPLDALIQRIGRCARRKGEEGRAIVLVETIEFEEFPTVKGFSDILGNILDSQELFVELTSKYKSGNREINLGHRIVRLPSGNGKDVYVGIPGTVKELTNDDKKRNKNKKRKKSPSGNLLIVPYDTAPYDPLVLLLSHDELGSLGQYLYDVEKAREALDRVYRFHYANNLTPREFHSAYVYFRELKLFSAPPEYELRSRPELYSMLYVLNGNENCDRRSKFEINRIIRVSHSTLKAQWENIKDCIKGKLVRRWNANEERYEWVCEKTSDRNPKALTIYAVSGEYYSPELGFWRGMSQEQNTKVKQASKEDDAGDISPGSRWRNNPGKTAQATLLDFMGVRE
ncbi:CRISPR-associated helicase Cas3' [Thermococcus thioreducens]|uniref:CRISPR-associated endonuclease/helicase Cas3 n=1 Tax=Thermococcus thioreducens TaxID=277988 RepID=A0A1I0P4U4_9EURY|nr:CRISPR-associated helicase Cas3' [Thermococcus thioreducens]ASJ12048.1 CRISPR-associated helicase Cas3 [Thermococcus thioreducens]SEW09385.1 CRISPR-associated endonuclease/helicase Cas3 [Thermococcus thioreducens]